MKIDKFHNGVIQIAKHRFAAEGEVPGTFFALTPNNTVIVCCKTFEDEKEKNDVFNIYAVILAVKKVSLYSFVSEMWFAQVKPGPFVMPSQQSDRKEGILIATRDKQNPLFKAFEIIRPENKLKDCNYDSHFKDYINLFDRVNPNCVTNNQLEQFAKEFDEIPKPEWYMEIGVDEL